MEVSAPILFAHHARGECPFHCPVHFSKETLMRWSNEKSHRRMQNTKSEQFWNRIISLWIIENVKNSWQYNNSTKFLSNFLQFKINFKFTCLTIRDDIFNMRDFNNDNMKSFYDRFVAKPWSHKSNFLRRDLYAFHFFSDLGEFSLRENLLL